MTCQTNMLRLNVRLDGSRLGCAITGRSLPTSSYLSRTLITVSSPDVSSQRANSCRIGFGHHYRFWYYQRITSSYEGLLGFKGQPFLSDIDYKRKDQETRLREIRELRQVQIERDDGHADLPTFGHFGMDFADDTDQLSAACMIRKTVACIISPLFFGDSRQQATNSSSPHRAWSERSAVGPVSFLEAQERACAILTRLVISRLSDAPTSSLRQVPPRLGLYRLTGEQTVLALFLRHLCSHPQPQFSYSLVMPSQPVVCILPTHSVTFQTPLPNW